MDLALAARLGAIAEATYSIAGTGPFAAPAALGFVGIPAAYVGGVNNIDACLLGVTADGIVLAFRGTLPLEFNQGQGAFISSLDDWMSDGSALLVAPGAGVAGKVHSGFFACYGLLAAMFAPTLQSLVAANPGVPLLVTGHSKGGAVAVIAAAMLAAANPAFQASALYTFAAPRPGDTPFVQAVNVLTPTIVVARFEFQDDIVPHLPPSDHLLDYLASKDPALQALSDVDYNSAGGLTFIDWPPPTPLTLESDSTKLEVERAFRLAGRLFHLQFTDIGKCHSMQNSYLPAITGTAAPDPTQVPTMAYSSPYVPPLAA